MTPEQKRAASAKELSNALPADPKDNGPTVLSSAAIKRAVNRLQPQDTTGIRAAADRATKL